MYSITSGTIKVKPEFANSLKWVKRACSFSEERFNGVYFGPEAIVATDAHRAHAEQSCPDDPDTHYKDWKVEITDAKPNAATLTLVNKPWSKAGFLKYLPKTEDTVTTFWINPKYLLEALEGMSGEYQTIVQVMVSNQRSIELFGTGPENQPRYAILMCMDGETNPQSSIWRPVLKDLVKEEEPL